MPRILWLLYSSGIRTTEARLLMRRSVDFGHGVLDIQKSKARQNCWDVMTGRRTGSALTGHIFLNLRKDSPIHVHGYLITFPCCGKKRTEKREILSPMISGIITLLQTSTAGKMTHLNLMTVSVIWQDQWDTDAQSLRCIIIQLSQGLQT